MSRLPHPGRLLLILALLSLALFGSKPAAAFDPAKLVAAAESQAAYTKSYDSSYHVLPYPGGDVPLSTGVCSDVVIRAYRAQGFDLQKLVHDDMARHFVLYPARWGLSHPDANIDHRRVPNLQVFFSRFGTALPVTADPADYKPGDLVTWNLAAAGRPIPHIGIVTYHTSPDGRRPLVVHNIGEGVKIEDTLFAFKITGHYRYAPATAE